MATRLRFGLSRHHAGERLEEHARAFATLLGATVEAAVQLVVTPDYDKLLEGVLLGGVDVAWMAPLGQLRALDEGALLAAVSERAGALGYRSALLVRDDSPWRSAADLAGARAAWSDPRSASGHLFPRLHLEAAGLDPRELGGEAFLGSPSQAAEAVASGRADLCACFVTHAAAAPARALDEVRRTLGAAATSLRVLDVTSAIPPDGMVLGAPLDGWWQSRLRDALLGLDRRPGGPAAIAALLQADRLAAVTDEAKRLLEGARTRYSR
jgi:phosphonate transport system substrate-binding protein